MSNEPTTEELSIEEMKKKITEQANEIRNLQRQKKYGLVWEDKPDAQVLRVRDEAPMLREDTTRTVVTDPNNVDHILINGDNFHALTALRATHAGKIDVIYIDPPYNTGNKDFIYNDNYLDTTDGYRHSKWLSFIEKRVVLARELLSDTGLIFVSIDDNEQARLKLLMDEKFGTENYVSTIVAQLNPRGRQSSSDVAESHEYLLIYRKTKAGSLLGEALTEDQRKEYSKTDPKNGLKYREIGLRLRGGRATAEEAPTLHFPLYVDPMTQTIYTEEMPNTVSIIPQFSDGTLGTWRWSKKKIELQKEELLARTVKRGGTEAWDIFQKDYLKETKTRKHKSVWFGDGINSDIGQREIVSLLGKGKFDYPKPSTYLKKILAMSTSDESIILDFFAGSGTTAHATMELNKEDGGNRQCILVTDGGKAETTGESSRNKKNEESGVNIAEEVTYERVRRVLTGKDWADGKEHEPLGGNLRYFEVEMKPLPYGSTEHTQRFMLDKYTADHGKIATNIFTEISSKNEMDDETLMLVDYKVFADESSARYLVGVNAHDYTLSEVETWFNTLPEEAEVTMVGSGLEEIDWVKKNLDRIKVDDIIGRVIRSRKYVASKLPLAE